MTDHLPPGPSGFTPLMSERLILRTMTVADAEDLALRRSDPEAAKFQSWTAPYPVERARAMIAAQAHLLGPTAGEWFGVVAVEAATGAIVGDVAIHVDDAGKTAELGYTLHAWARGRGFATESAAMVLDYLFGQCGIHRVEASTDPRNAASIRVLERLGFTLEGVKRESYWLGDTVTDDAMWGLLAREWVAPNTP